MTPIYDLLKRTWPVLPAFDELKLYFDTDIRREQYPLRKLLVTILNRTEDMKGMIRTLLEPDTGNIMGMYEHSRASTDLLEEAYRLYKELCHLERTIHVAQLSTRAKDHADTIADAFAQWPRLQNSTKLIVTQLRDNWNASEQQDHWPEYLG